MRQAHPGSRQQGSSTGDYDSRRLCPNLPTLGDPSRSRASCESAFGGSATNLGTFHAARACAPSVQSKELAPDVVGEVRAHSVEIRRVAPIHHIEESEAHVEPVKGQRPAVGGPVVSLATNGSTKRVNPGRWMEFRTWYSALSTTRGQIEHWELTRPSPGPSDGAAFPYSHRTAFGEQPTPRLAP